MYQNVKKKIYYTRIDKIECEFDLRPVRSFNSNNIGVFQACLQVTAVRQIKIQCNPTCSVGEFQAL